MEHFKTIYYLILSGLRNEISNEYKLQNYEIFIKLADNSIAKLSLKRRYLIYTNEKNNKYKCKYNKWIIKETV